MTVFASNLPTGSRPRNNKVIFGDEPVRYINRLSSFTNEHIVAA